MSQMPPLAANFDELLKSNYQKWSNRNYIWTMEGQDYKPKTFGQLIEDSWSLAGYLHKEKLSGQHYMIFSENSYEWMVIDMAIMAYSGVSVGANKDWLEYDMLNAIDVTHPQILFYSESNRETVSRLKEQRSNITYVSIEHELPQWLIAGREFLEENPDCLRDRARDPEEPCKIVFTSGTTSLPKAVMISYDNMVACGEGLYERTPTTEDDVYYLFLPLHHVYGGVAVFACSFFMGCEVYVSNNIRELRRELSLARPTIFCGVPLVYERIYQGIDEATQKKIAKAMRLTDLLNTIGIDVRRKVFKRLHEFFGGNIRYLFCGGSDFSRELKQFFRATGFDMIEGYGMSETSSMIAMEYSGATEVEGVGSVFDEMEYTFVNPDDQGWGELAVKGPNVTAGYYNNPVATRSAFDEEGYFLTGDIGYINREGNLCITGRKERRLVTKGGENVALGELEDLLMRGDERLVKATIFMADDQLVAQLYVEQGNGFEADNLLSEVNATLPKYKQVHSYHLSEINDDSIVKR